MSTSEVFSDATEIARGSDVMIRLDHVDKFFGDFQALKDVNLAVGRSEVVVVIGPSGSGKSTMIRCINRLEEHDSGRIVVDGTELSKDVRNIQEIRRETGMVFQQFNLFPHLTVLDNITLAPRQVRKVPKAEAEDKAMALLDRVRIPEQARKYPGQLSGGQQQRRHRSHAGHGTQGDPLRRADLGARPGDDQRGPRGHDGPGPRRHDHDLRDPRDGFAREVADRAVFMANGEIVEVGEPEHFFTDPREPRTRAFLSQIL
ncbi:MAG: amino acid ABC transporter ATP-binding protein [Ilumatobacteraceae bacterium]